MKNVTIEQARKILKKKGKKMTDKEILDLLAMLRLICDRIISDVIENK